MKELLIKQYQCEICGSSYNKKKDAEMCESYGVQEPVCEVGDIVYMKAGYMWFDGDERWVINPEARENKRKHNDEHNCFRKCCTMAFYYVVTAIEKDPVDGHCLRYHVFTKAMTGKNGHSNGWTMTHTHVTPKRISKKKIPQFIIDDSKDLIGKKSEHLI